MVTDRLASKFKVSACTAEHIGDRAEQQDRVAIIASPRHPQGLLAVVADGMGGRTGGRMASDQVISTATHVFRDLAEEDAGGLAGLLKMIADEAHTVIKLSALSTEKEPHAAFVALIVRKDYAIWAHAGDCRLYHFRSGKLLKRTQDQTYAAHLRASGREQEAIEAEKRYKHILVSSLGLKQSPTLAVDDAGKLMVGDAFLMCSDGLWAYFEDEELGGIVAAGSVREASDTLVRLARERAQARGDNLSLAIVRLDPPESR